MLVTMHKSIVNYVNVALMININSLLSCLIIYLLFRGRESRNRLTQGENYVSSFPITVSFFIVMKERTEPVWLSIERNRTKQLKNS